MYIFSIIRFIFVAIAFNVTIVKGSFEYKFRRDNKIIAEITFGKSFANSPKTCGENCYDYGEVKLIIEQTRENLWKIKWESNGDSTPIVDCLDLGDQYWYGGPEQFNQEWPIQNLILKMYPMVTKQTDNAAIIEPYWLGSNGTFILVDDEIPLFVDQNNIEKGKLCLIANNTAPYSSNRPIKLTYLIGNSDNVRSAHSQAIYEFLGKPSDIPDERMISDPIWSTWARYKTKINESVIVAFAEEILQNNFTNSQLEIDDDWETCYGALEFHPSKFPNPKKLTDTLKSKGFRVTLWIHPFINKNCEPYFSEANSNGFLVKNEQGKVETQWWNSESNGAGQIDFTNPKATSWWSHRLNQLKINAGIDSFKFDAGESSWAPQIPMLNKPLGVQPNILTTDYVKTCANFGNMVEVRSGSRSQYLPIFVRMIDKDTRWGFDNGLRSLVTTLIQMNINGYPLVLPDMVGGNAYNDDKVTKELFIRWLQANTFMPSIQFSITPWDIDEETTTICHKFINIHRKYAPKIIEAAKNAVTTGLPINPPIWWTAPNDPNTFPINDQYLLGEDILVAPVMELGATSRDIYIPEGKWKNENNGEIIRGGQWLRNYTAPLDVLPYFSKIYSSSNN